MGSSVAAVLFVFTLLGAALFFARRAARTGTVGLSLHVVDAVNLGSGRTLTVVRSGRRFFLLGATNHAISLIAELDADDVHGDKQAAEPNVSPSRLPVVSAFLKSLGAAR